MADDLFDSLAELDARTLRAAGYIPCDYAGLRQWRCPDGKTLVSEAEALRRLDAAPKEGPTDA